MDFNIIRTNRKTMAIYVRNDGSVEVRAPKRMDLHTIEQFVHSKTDWIKSKITIARKTIEQKQEHIITYGDDVRYLGEYYPIQGREGPYIGFQNEFYIPYGLLDDQVKQAVIQIYKLLAKQVIQSKVKHYAQIMRVSPTSIRVNSAKTRWGSCSSKGGLNFSWRLVMAEESVVDYVVVHELSHLLQMNHSKEFWRIVESILPQFQEEKRKLKGLEKKLQQEVWE